MGSVIGHLTQTNQKTTYTKPDDTRETLTRASVTHTTRHTLGAARTSLPQAAVPARQHISKIQVTHAYADTGAQSLAPVETPLGVIRIAQHTNSNMVTSTLPRTRTKSEASSRVVQCTSTSRGTSTDLSAREPNVQVITSANVTPEQIPVNTTKALPVQVTSPISSTSNIYRNTNSGSSNNTCTDNGTRTRALIVETKTPLSEVLPVQPPWDVKTLPSLLGNSSRKRIEWDTKQRFEMSRVNLKPLPKKSAPGGECWDLTELKPHGVPTTPSIQHNEQQLIQEERNRIDQLLRTQKEQRDVEATQGPSLKERLEKRQTTAADRRRDILDQRKQKCRERVDRVKHISHEMERSRVSIDSSDVAQQIDTDEMEVTKDIFDF